MENKPEAAKEGPGGREAPHTKDSRTELSERGRPDLYPNCGGGYTDTHLCKVHTTVHQKRKIT